MKLSIKPCRQAAARDRQSSDIADFMLRAAAEESPANTTVAQMVKNTAPPPGPKKDVRPPSFAAIFARRPVRGSAPTLLPFGHAALKTGSAQPLPIASKPLQSNYR